MRTAKPKNYILGFSYFFFTSLSLSLSLSVYLSQKMMSGGEMVGPVKDRCPAIDSGKSKSLEPKGNGVIKSNDSSQL